MRLFHLCAALLPNLETKLQHHKGSSLGEGEVEKQKIDKHEQGEGGG